jgi:hypothetical protein
LQGVGQGFESPHLHQGLDEAARVSYTRIMKQDIESLQAVAVVVTNDNQ